MLGFPRDYAARTEGSVVETGIARGHRSRLKTPNSLIEGHESTSTEGFPAWRDERRVEPRIATPAEAGSP
jgi:hypothetical protein